MPSSTSLRLVRSVAVTTAAALVATGALGAAPALAVEPLQYTATTSTGVVDLVLTLPSAVPGLPNPVELTLLGTQGAVSGGGDADVSQASSFLAGGSLVTDSPLSPLLAPLGRVLTADLEDPGPKEADVLEVPDNPLGLELGVGAQSAAVTPAPDEDTVLGPNRATSEVADAALGSLRDLGLAPVLEPLFAGLNTAVAAAVQQSEPLREVVETLPSLPSIAVPNPLRPVVGGPATIPTPTPGGPAVAATVEELPARIAALQEQLLDGAVLELSALDTLETVTPRTDRLEAFGGAELATADLFGGLVQVRATQATARATAALVRGNAVSDASATLVELRVADEFGELLEVVAGSQGITAGLLDGSLGQTLDPSVRPTVQAVDAALDAVLEQLVTLLEALGGSGQLIRQGTVTEKVLNGGRRVEAHASPALVTLGLPVAKNLVTLAIGKADAVAAVGPPAITGTGALPEPETETLPRTGAEPLAGFAALALLSAALLVRRRRTA